jgi:hypothetical protein
MRCLGGILLLLCWPLLAAAQAPPATQQYDSLLQTLRTTRKSQDYPAYLAAALQFRDFLHSSPASLVPVVRAYSLTSNLPAALEAFRQFVAMGQYSDEFLNSADFAALRSDPGFAPLAVAMKGSQTATSLATTSFTLGALSSLVAEDVDYSTSIKSFLFTSVRGKKIFAATSDGQVREFAHPAINLPLLALKVDSRHGILWVSAVGLRDFSSVPAAARGQSVLLCYDLTSGKLLRQLDGPPSAVLGDFTISSVGDLFLADNGGAVYRLPHDSSAFERLDHGEFTSPQTPALSVDAQLLFVPDYTRGIAVLELASRTLRWLDPQGQYALSGIDGLYFFEGKLIAAQNGTSPERVVLFTLDPTLSRITSETVIERSTPSLGDPTHGVMVDKSFFYIANSGWDTVDDHGALRPGTTPTPPRLMRFAVP